MTFMNISPGHEVPLPGRGSRPNQVHVFDAEMIDAIDAALAAQRPLLVRGEPGIGKSQLAKAAAKHLGRVFLSHVVDARTESSDLLWHYDAVARLADAQLASTFCSPGESPEKLRERLSVQNYLHPGPLWWAFNWADAAKQAKQIEQNEPPQDSDPSAPLQPDPKRGSVLLIDEIDKAESDVPNGLLEALGSGEFTPLGRATSVLAETGTPPPLVVITTNNERSLPDAFIRRCLVLRLELPEDAQALQQFLFERGKRHFPKIADEVLTAAAERLVGDRRHAKENRQFPLPGQAEYLDLVRAVTTLESTADRQIERLQQLSRYAFRKHPDSPK
ncbi:MAG: AAA family ATPase [Candidatus Methylumidiphilus sp.]